MKIVRRVLDSVVILEITGDIRLGELVGYLSRFKDEGKRMRLVKPNPVVMKLLALTRLDQFFKVCPDEASALEDFVS